jgi:hypothetical protein
MFSFDYFSTDNNVTITSFKAPKCLPVSHFSYWPKMACDIGYAAMPLARLKL